MKDTITNECDNSSNSSIRLFYIFLNETRLYPTVEESLLRATVWFLTWGIGIYAFHTTNEPYIIVLNYILMAGSYLLDVLFNLLTQEKRLRSQLLSRITNVILLLFPIAILIMSSFQLFNYIGTKTIMGQSYYFILFVLGILLVLKPFIDFICMLLCSESVNDINYNQSSSSHGIVYHQIVSSEYKKEIEEAAQSGALTNSTNSKG